MKTDLYRIVAAVIGIYCSVTLWYMSISAGIVVSISFQKVYDTPHAKTCADCDYKSF